MNWKLIFLLSLFGLAMGIATVFVIPSKIEPIFWLVIFVICAWILGRSTAKPFLNGLLLGIVNSIWITGCHILLFSTYISTHPQEAAMMRSMPASITPRVMMAITGPIVGVISGVIIGVLAFIVARILRRPAAATT